MLLHLKQNVFSAIVALFCLLIFQQTAYSQQVVPEEEEQEESQENVVVTGDTLVQAIIDSVEVEEIIPEFPEDLVRDRIACMETTIPMTYNNTIKGFINYLTVRKRGYTATMIERKDLYFPLFESHLKKHGLPDELKYLSIVESGLNPKAVSPARAVGLWQFMAPTGRMYRLYQDSYIDERMDPYKSTEAACRYLKDLHGIFGDWELALAAYNCGPGNVRRAIRRSGNKTGFWQIYNYLPRETRAYVPMFVAVNYVMNHTDEYNIKADSLAKYIPADTILVSQHLDLDLLSKHLEVSVEDLKALNPQLKKNAVPAYVKNYSLRIPYEKKEFFTINRIGILDSITAATQLSSIQLVADHDDSHPSSGNKNKVIHRVRSGEVLGKIADKYHVSLTNIKKWNNLKSNRIAAGQKLVIWVNGKAEPQVAQSETKANAPTASSTPKKLNVPSEKVYLVQPGDTLWRISQTQGIPVEKLKKLNNLKSNELKPGQKIIVG